MRPTALDRIPALILSGVRPERGVGSPSGLSEGRAEVAEMGSRIETPLTGAQSAVMGARAVSGSPPSREGMEAEICANLLRGM